jgi:hypothetical protein
MVFLSVLRSTSTPLAGRTVPSGSLISKTAAEGAVLGQDVVGEAVEPKP